MKRRIAVVAALSLLLSVAVPPGVVPAGGSFPLSGLLNLFRMQAWAADPVGGGPVQMSADPRSGHYVSTDATRSDGGAGRAPGKGKGALDAAQTAQPDRPQWTSPSTGKGGGFSEGTSVRVAKNATTHSDDYQNADGSMTRRVSAEPVNYKAPDGTYRKIDPKLRARGGRLDMGDNAIGVSFAMAAPETRAKAANQSMASMTLPTGERLEFSLQGAAAVWAGVTDGTATYPDVLPYTDMELSTYWAGLKETIVLKSPSAGNEWVFPLRLSGLTTRQEADGSITLLNASGKPVMWIPLAYMEDSNVDPKTGAPAQSSDVRYDLVTVDGGPALRMTADRAWLADPARVYPVRVDPPATTGTTGDVYVDNDTTTTNHNGHDLPVGTFDGTHIARSFIHFDNFDNDGLVGKRFTSASLNLFHTWSYDCNHHLPVYVHKILETWTVAALTNNAGLASGPAYSSPIGSLSISDNYPACLNSAANRGVGAWVAVPLNPRTFDEWSVIGGNFGLALSASETDPYGWKRFTSANYSAGVNMPTLDLTWESNIAPQVDDQYPGYGQAVTTLTPELLADAHDPDAFPKSMTYTFTLYDKNDVVIATSNAQPGRSWKVPVNAMTWGNTYKWDVVVNDGALNSTPWKSALLTPVPQPLVTSGLSQNDGQGFEASIGNYTTAATDASVPTIGPAVAIERSYNSQDPRQAQAFGSGWSSPVDTLVTERLATDGVTVLTAVVTYPTGQEIAFGRNDNGSFSPPAGRFAVFTPAAGGGYTLKEKDGTSYSFTKSLGAHRFGITARADVNGRTATFGYDANDRMDTITSASGRALHLVWTQPAGATAFHVTTVKTDELTAGDQNSANTWTYSYTGDALTTVCPPTSQTACTGYSYTSGSIYQTAVANAGPSSYWRLNEASGTAATSSVVENAGVDNGVYANVALGQVGPLANSAATAAGFNGTSSRVTLPARLDNDAAYQSVSLWFKTAGGDGVLYGQSYAALGQTTTSAAYNPTLYMGTDGKLLGGFPTNPGVGVLGPLQGAGSGRCVDVIGNVSTNGTRIQLYDCNGGANQSWTLTAAGLLQVTSGGVVKCLDAVGYGTTDGTELSIYTCTGTTNQQWVMRADGSIRGVGSGLCVDARGVGTSNGTRLQLWSCGRPGTSNQSWFPRTHAALQSSSSYADNQWHHVVLSARGTSQTLYVDGVSVAAQTGVAVSDIAATESYLGAGYLGGGWPDQSHTVTTSNTGTLDYFSGSLAEVARFDSALTDQTVAELYAARTPVKPLTSVLRPSGNSDATVTYDPVTGRVLSVVDANGGLWRPQAASVAGTTQVYSSEVLGAAPIDYWRFADSGGADAVNQVNGGVATYSAVTLGQTDGPFAPAPNSTVAKFNGTSSYVTLPPEAIPTTGPASVSMWFKLDPTRSGVLYSYQTMAIGNPTGAGQWTPALYVGTDGKLRGEFYVSSASPMTSTVAVNDSKWHHVALAMSATGQVLYLDGAKIGTKTVASATTAVHAYVGAGKWASWPLSSGNEGYFPGKIAEFAYFATELSEAQVSAQVGARTMVQANTQPYVSTVMNASPAGYWRLGDSGGTNAVNETTGGFGVYTSVTLGVLSSPFEGTANPTVATFNGSSMRLPAGSFPTTGPASVSMWFKTSTSGVLYGYQTTVVGNPDGSTNWVPALYIGTDGKLRGEFWRGSIAPITTTGTVTDNKWHHVALAASSSQQVLYLDGAVVGTVNAAMVTTNATVAYIGAGKWNTWTATSGKEGYFKGQLAEVAYFASQLSAAQVTAQFGARVGAPMSAGVNFSVLDPLNNVTTEINDAATGRKVAEIDARGYKTQFGYDTAGFLRTMTDANGNMTINEHDQRGNLVSTTTCQDRSANKCSTAYYSYYLDPDPVAPINDRLKEERSPSDLPATDPTYRTTYEYDAAGNRTRMTDPLGRVTAVTYTDGTTIAAADGGFAPAGLPSTVTQPGGGVQTIVYYANGDIASVTDPAGKVTSYVYDRLGRTVSATEAATSGHPALLTSYTFDRLDRVATRTDPTVQDAVNSSVTHIARTTTTYTDDGQVASVTVADLQGVDNPRTVTYEYDAHGCRTKETVDQLIEADSVTRFDCDVLGRVIRQRYSDGTAVRTDYDAAGNELGTVVEDYSVDPLNPTQTPVRTLAYDPAGRLASTTDAMGWITSYTYTDNNLLVSVTRHNPTTQESFVDEENFYDAAGREIKQITNNGATTTTRGYDAAGRTTSVTLDPTGLNRTTTNVYSPDDDVVEATTSRGSTTLGVSQSLYDLMGRPLASVTYPSLDTTPVGRWRLNETAGNSAADAAGNSTATASGVTWSTAHGGSATLDGTASAIVTDGPVVDTERSFTVAAWVKLDAGATGDRTAVSQDGTRTSGFQLKWDAAANRWQWQLCTPNTLVATCATAVSDGAAATGTWTHIAGVYNATTGQVKLYVDGQPRAGTGSKTSASGGAKGRLAVGRGEVAGVAAEYWPGGVSDVQVYQKALTDVEVAGVTGGTLPVAGASVVRASRVLDVDGTIRQVTDARANTTYVVTDAVGRPVQTVSPHFVVTIGDGQPVDSVAVTRTGYNTFGETSSVQDANGNITSYRYDELGLLREVEAPHYTAPGSSTSLAPVTRYTYNAVGQVVAAEDPSSNVTSYEYDSLGRLITTTSPGNAITRYEYTLNGDRTKVTDPTGAVTEATYDYLGRTLTSTQVIRATPYNAAAIAVTTYGYGTSPWPTTITSPSSVVTHAEYNAAGEQTALVDGASNRTETTFDGVGRVVKVKAPDNTYSTVDYDLVGRPYRKASFAADNTLLKEERQSYDAGANVVGSVDGNGTTTTFSYNSVGWLVAQSEPISPTDSIETTFGYDAAGNQTRFTDGRGNPFITTYNVWGQPESQIEPATPSMPALADRTFTIGYDVMGRAVHAALPGGVSTDWTYNVAGRVTQQSGSGAEAVTANRNYTYDLAGRLLTAAGSAGTTTINYDDRSLPVAVSGASGASAFVYRLDGAMTSRTDAAGTTVYGYDIAGRLDTVANTAAGVNAKYHYDPVSQVDTITYNTTGDVRYFGYDELHRMTTDELRAGLTQVAKITYGYDHNDNVVQKDTIGFGGSPVNNAYVYDKADRLVEWDSSTSTPVTYGYDKSGNRIQVGPRTFAYDQRNQLVSSSDGTTYAYTPRGTLAHTTKDLVDQATSADAFGQVVSQAGPGGTAQYSYDGLGRAVQAGMSYTGLGNSLAGDGSALYVRGPGDDVLGVVQGITARLMWTDQHTDVVGQFTPTGSTLAASAVYDPWGAVIGGSGMLGRLGYQSELTEAQTGRVNMLARWYNPDTGAFDTRDDATLSAAGNAGRANRFAYAEGDPVGNTDPTGHMVQTKEEYGCRGSAEECDALADELEILDAKREIARQEAEYRKAERESHVDLLKILIDVGVGMLLDMIGYYSVVGCFGSGNLWDCFDLVSSLAGPLKILKIGKSIWKAIDRGMSGYKMWKRIVDGARTVMRRASELLNQARKHLNDLLSKLAHKPKAPKKPKKPDKPKDSTPKKPNKPKQDKPAKPDKAKSSPDKPSKPKENKPAKEKPKNEEPRKQREPDKHDPDKPKEPEPAKSGRQGCLDEAVAHSFDPSTPVLMADGSVKAIGEVAVGDEVVATDPVAGESQARPVTAVHRNVDAELTDVTVSSVASSGSAVVPVGEGVGGRSTRGPTAVVHTTAHHPFWDATAGVWRNAASLKAGESTLVGPDGQLLYVVDVRTFIGSKDMRDLTVATTHTYYVVAGTTPVLVHNCGEESTAKAIQDAFPERNVRTGRPVYREDGTQLTDHDVYDDDFICEVACGGGTGKVAQMEQRILPSANGTRVAVYGPNLKGSVVKGIEKLGVPVFRSLDDLIAWVGPKP